MKSILAILLVVVVAAPVGAEDLATTDPGSTAVPESPATPLPWTDFRALVTEWAKPSGSEVRVAVVGDLLAVLDAQAGTTRSWAAMLEGVVPQACYAAAHTRIGEFFAWFLASHDHLRPLIEQQASLDDALPYVRLLVEVARARFPELHMDDEAIAPGYRLDLTAALSSADCDEAT